jgi:transcriptional regulator with XRE-family HTH domain
MSTNTIRDLRESKGLSQTAAAEICGLSFSRYERIEMGSPRTTDAEIAAVTKALRGAKKTGKKLVGRPFSDPVKQAAVEAARANGGSVAQVLATVSAMPQLQIAQSEPVAEKKAASARKASAPRKSTTRTRKTAATKKAEEALI